MPQQASPPYLQGAKQYPRTIHKWDDVNAQNGKLKRTETYITLPLFSIADKWNGYSDIVASFNFEASKAFSLKALTEPTNPNYALCISYRVGQVVTRYLLWNATGSNFNQVIVPYSGQTIAPNFRLEVWNTSQGVSSQATDIVCYTSKLGSIDYRYGGDSALVEDGGMVTGFNNISSAITLPTTSLILRWKSDVGVTPIPTVSNWVDSVNALDLAATGTVVLLSSSGLTPDPVMTFGGGYLQGGALAIEPTLTTIAFKALGGGVVYDNGGETKLSVDAGTMKFNAFIDGVSNMTVVYDTWYIATLNTVTGVATIYDMITGIQLDQFSATINYLADVAQTIGPCFCAVAELSVHQSATEERAIVDYYVSAYFDALSLPLTFPSTSVSTTN